MQGEGADTQAEGRWSGEALRGKVQGIHGIEERVEWLGIENEPEGPRSQRVMYLF